MGRWDAALLSTPSIEAMLIEARQNENIAQLQQQEMQSLQTKQAERQMLASLTNCPKCSCRLSAIDAKMGNCLACGSSLSPDNNNQSLKAEGSAAFIVRI